MMKSYTCGLALVAALGLTLGGCANQSSTTASNTAATKNPGSASYSQDELNKTGRQKSNEQIEQVDPSARAIGR